MESRRIHYIDWLRVLAVLLLFPYHSGRVFNANELFYAKSPVTSVPIDYLLSLVEPWHMPLLFFLAGASTLFAMRRRSVGRYAGERALRLLVPLVFGIFVLVPPQTWYGARTNAGYTGSFVEYLQGPAWSLDNLFGRGDYYGGISPAHLWFILFLWLISMICLPLLAYARSERGASRLDSIGAALAKPVWWPLVILIIMVAEAMPEIGGKNLVFYLVYFVLGYLLFRSDRFAENAERRRLPALLIGGLLCLVLPLLWRIEAGMPDPSLPRAIWTYAALSAGWLMVVALIGYGRRALDRPSAALAYLGEASYPLYILHQTVIVVIGFYLVQYVQAPFLGWPLLMVLGAIGTFALYDLVRRAKPLRVLFGMRA